MTKVTLSNQCARALTKMAQGGWIEARRTYPFAHKYWLLRKVGRVFKRYAAPLAKGTVSELVTRRLIVAQPKDTQCDSIDYRITKAGKDVAVHGGEIEYDDGAIDWVEEMERRQDGAA